MKNLLIIFALSLLASCNKDDSPKDKLPPATQEGKNTAGCYINGKLLVPKDGETDWWVTVYGLSYTVGNHFWPDKDDYWQMRITNSKDLNIYIYIRNMKDGNGDYIVGQSNGDLYDDASNNNQIIVGTKINGIVKTYWSSDNSGVITVTRADYSQERGFIYSGTFSCTLYNKDNLSETIQVTEGRFDINGRTLNK